MPMKSIILNSKPYLQLLSLLVYYKFTIKAFGFPNINDKSIHIIIHFHIKYQMTCHRTYLEISNLLTSLISNLENKYTKNSNAKQNTRILFAVINRKVIIHSLIHRV